MSLQPTTDVEPVTEIDYAHQEGLALILQARAIKVVDQPSYEAGATFARVVKAHIQRIRDFMKPIKSTAKAAHDATVQQEKLLLEGPEAALAEVGKQMTSYDNQQRELKRQADAEAAAAAKLANNGSAVPVIILPTQVAIPQAEGVSHRSTWKAVVTNKMELIKAVAAGKVSPDALDANLPVLNEWSRQRQQALNVPGVKAEEVRTMVTKA